MFACMYCMFHMHNHFSMQYMPTLLDDNVKYVCLLKKKTLKICQLNYFTLLIKLNPKIRSLLAPPPNNNTNWTQI